MGKRVLFLALVWGMALCVSISVFGSNTVTSSFNGKRAKKQLLNVQKNEINALALNCEISENKIRKSFATVLRLSTKDKFEQKYDVAITTGHGLLGADGNLFANCFVSYPGSENIPVTAAKLAPNFKVGTPSDWGVIIFPTIKQGKLIRYSVGDNFSQKSFEGFAEMRPSVLFSTARGLPTNGQNCSVEPRRFAGLGHKKFLGFLSHTCRAIPGQSGTPISIIQNQNPILIGIHVGNSMVYGYPTMNTPLHYRGYMRGIDAVFMTEFSKVLASMNIKFQEKRIP